MEDSNHSNKAWLRLHVIYANIFKAGDRPASESVELRALEKPERSYAWLLSNLLNGDFDGSGKSFSGLIGQFVDVISDLQKDVPAGCGAEDDSHARFLRFASRAVASVFRSDQNL